MLVGQQVEAEGGHRKVHFHLEPEVEEVFETDTAVIKDEDDDISLIKAVKAARRRAHDEAGKEVHFQVEADRSFGDVGKTDNNNSNNNNSNNDNYRSFNSETTSLTPPPPTPTLDWEQVLWPSDYLDDLCEITLERADGGPVSRFGVDCKENSGEGSLEIVRISEDGALAAWNTAHSGKQVEVGDQILSVNGDSGKPALLLKRMLCDRHVEIVISRSTGSDSSSHCSRSTRSTNNERVGVGNKRGKW